MDSSASLAPTELQVYAHDHSQSCDEYGEGCEHAEEETQEVDPCVDPNSGDVVDALDTLLHPIGPAGWDCCDDETPENDNDQECAQHMGSQFSSPMDTAQTLPMHDDSHLIESQWRLEDAQANSAGSEAKGNKKDDGEDHLQSDEEKKNTAYKDNG